MLHTNRGTLFLEHPAASATYFDLEYHHYEMLVKHCERIKCITVLLLGVLILYNLFKERACRLHASCRRDGFKEWLEFTFSLLVHNLLVFILLTKQSLYLGMRGALFVEADPIET